MGGGCVDWYDYCSFDCSYPHCRMYEDKLVVVVVVGVVVDGVAVGALRNDEKMWMC